MLVQLKSGNNSEKLKNEIRKLLYSLHRSKKLTRTIYNKLINTIKKQKHSENSKTNEPHRFRLILADKLNLKDPNENMILAHLSTYYTWKTIKSVYNNNKFKISAPIWNDEFNFTDGSYSISDIQGYFGYITKNYETIANNTPVQIYTNNIRNRIVSKIEADYKLELVSPETMKLLESAKKTIDQDKDGEDVPKLESVEVVLSTSV